MKVYKALTTYTSLSSLIVHSRKIDIPQGTEKGVCAFCGLVAQDLFTLELSPSFTRSDFLHNTGYICSSCYHLYTSQEYRLSNWLCTPDSFHKLKREEVIATILSLSPENVPFAIYTTKTYKKQGWLNLLKKLNHSSNSFIIGYDMCVLFITREKLLNFKNQAEYYRSKGLTKTEILTAKLTHKSLDLFDNPREILKTLTELKTNLNWQWVINFVK